MVFLIQQTMLYAVPLMIVALAGIFAERSGVINLPDSILSGVRTMTANIVLEMGYAADGIHRNALIATAVVLFVFILIINLSFSLLRRRND